MTTSDGRPYAVAVMPWHVTEEDPPHPRTRVGAWISNHELFKALVKDGWVVDVLTTAQTDTYMVDGVYVYPLADATVQDRNDLADVVFSPLEDKGRAFDFWAEKTRARIRTGYVKFVKLAHGHPSSWAAIVGLNFPNLIVFNSLQLHDEAQRAGLLADPYVRSIVVPPVVWPTDRRSAGDHILQTNIATEDKGRGLFMELASTMPYYFVGIERKLGDPGRMMGNYILGPQLDMGPIYEKAKIHLMPSKVESYGRAAVEAATYGIPTIAHPTPGLLEALGPAGIFVDRTDVDGWKREISRLQHREEWLEANAMALCLADKLTPEEDLEMFVTTMKELL